jgi:hypothetical protein
VGSSFRYGDALDAVPQHSDTGWSDVSNGMQQVALGWGLLLGGLIMGGALFWLGTAGYPWVIRLAKGPFDQTAIVLTGLGILGLALIIGYGAILIGQWRCLMHAPERQGAKELMLVCITCIIGGSLLTLAAPFLGGVINYQTLHQGFSTEELNGLERWRIFQGPKLLALLGISLVLLNGVLFTQFLRTVANCFSNHFAARNADFLTLFVGLLVGGSVGAFFCAHELSFRSNLVLASVAGWGTYAACHVVLICGIRKCIARGGGLQAVESCATSWLTARTAASSPSGLHPVLR